MKIITALVIDEDGYVVDLNQDNVWKWTGINGASWGGGTIQTLPNGKEDKCINISTSLYGKTSNTVPDWIHSDYTISIWTKINYSAYAACIFPGSRGTRNSGISISPKETASKIQLMWYFYNGIQNNVYFVYSENTPYGNINILDDKWHHIALTRYNYTIYFFIDGIKYFTINTKIETQYDLLPPMDSPLYLNNGFIYGSNDRYRHCNGLVYQPTIVDACLWTNSIHNHAVYREYRR